jgi:3-deoxy-manno-octulosonate cytidylyltransferase (CMP-KDO synthetase)
VKVVCIIPARLASTRFPRKVLARIGGKTMLEHVFIGAKKCPEFHDIYFAVDSEEVACEVEKFGGKYKMTSTKCPSGTHRLIEFIETSNIYADVYVNWQADEPLVHPQMIKDLLQGIYNPLESIWTLKKEAEPEEVHNPNVVKVVSDINGRALYFSRSPIPYNRDRSDCKYFKHIGLYAYTKSALLKIKELALSPLSETEKLEQLTFLENGLPIHVYLTEHQSVGVDTTEDLSKASRLLLSQN